MLKTAMIAAVCSALVLIAGCKKQWDESAGTPDAGDAQVKPDGWDVRGTEKKGKKGQVIVIVLLPFCFFSFNYSIDCRLGELKERGDFVLRDPGLVCFKNFDVALWFGVTLIKKLFQSSRIIVFRFIVHHDRF